MARRGKFGRSGTTQNLSVLVYQLLKEQMRTELDNIMEAYKTNMRDGKYTQQFNGQNVDGAYVMDYMRQMMLGFPPGSTEYETLNSQLSSFTQQYENDVSDLVINAMNNGTQIDFGLLGSQFANKGISEVTFTDVSEWSKGRIDELIANGDVTRADKLKGAVFVAGFNVENDGKSAAVKSKKMTYAQYNTWLKGQLSAALANGLTKDSEAYRSILRQQADAESNARVDTQNRNFENADKRIRDALGSVNAAAQAIINSYNGAFKNQMQEIWNQVSQDSLAPDYDFIKKLAELKDSENYGGLYADLMGQIEGGNLDELFAQATAESNAALAAIQNDNLGDMTTAQKNSIYVLLRREHGAGLSFLANSGISFTSGAGASVVHEMENGLTQAGVSFELQGNKRVGIGGHPEAVLRALGGMKDYLDKSGDKTYTWLNDAANGQLDVAFARGTVIEAFDTQPKDGKITPEEFQAGFSSGKFSKEQIADAQSKIVNNLAGEDIPGSNLEAAAVVNILVDAHWARYALSQGSIMIVDSLGHTKVTDVGDKDVGNSEMMPYTIPGTKDVVYVMPSTIKQRSENGDLGEMDRGLVNGIDISVYHTPSNYGTGVADGDPGMVLLKGNFKDASGTNRVQAFKIPLRMFETYLREHGIELDSTGFLNPTQDNGGNITVSFTGAKDNPSQFFENMFNPASTTSIMNITVRDTTDPRYGQPLFTNVKLDDMMFDGSINKSSDWGGYLTSLLSDKTNIMSKAQAIAANRGKKVPDQDDLLDAVLRQGLANNLPYATIKDAVSRTSVWINAMKSDFPDVKPAEPKKDSFGMTWSNGITTTVYGASQTGDAGPESDYMKNAKEKQTPGYNTAFVSGAFRKAPELVGSTKPAVKDTSVPAVTTTTPTVKPTNVPKVTPAGTKPPTGNPSSGYTRGTN